MPELRETLKPIVENIPFFNFFPEKEIERLWKEFSDETYSAIWIPVLAYNVNEFKTWLRSHNWKV
ncbi:MAG: hypothetical protein WC389_17080 [Lutibacter sp.]|jgi:hypothetical protein